MMTKQDSLHKVLSTVPVYDKIVVVIGELALDLAVVIPNSVYVLWQKDSVRFISEIGNRIVFFNIHLADIPVTSLRLIPHV